jgi:hypothetical protein
MRFSQERSERAQRRTRRIEKDWNPNAEVPQTELTRKAMAPPKGREL